MLSLDAVPEAVLHLIKRRLEGFSPRFGHFGSRCSQLFRIAIPSCHREIHPEAPHFIRRNN